MTAPRVRADYDQLAQIASGFGAQADGTRGTLQKLRKEMGVLSGGDWVGQGATAFYSEMNDIVLPMVNRLMSALQSAQSVTRQISQLMKTGEDEAAAFFKLIGGGAAGAFAGAAASATGSTGGGGGFLSSVGSFFSSVGRGALDFLGGAFDEAKDMVGGIVHMVTHPIDTLKGLAYGVTHPGELWDAFKKPYVEAWESGHPWRAIGRGALFVGSFFIGAGEAGAAGKAGAAAGKAGEAAKLAELAAAAGKAGDLGKAADLAAAAGKAGELAGQAGRVADLAKATHAAEAARAARLADMAAVAAKYPKITDAAEALGKAAKGSTEAAELAEYIAAQSTHIKPPAGRVVLGKWEKTGGYIGEAKANGGIWYETADGVYGAAGKEATWATNEAFLRQQMQSGVSRLDFHGLNIQDELLANVGKSYNDLPARVKEIVFLQENAAKYGYIQQGNSFVRAADTAAGGLSAADKAAGIAAGAGVAGQTVTTADEAHR